MTAAALAVASAFLSAATRVRRALHGAGVLRATWLPAPTVSVGNLAAGGTGKTPLVEHLARELADLGARPVVLARGYGPPVAGSALNDEGLVLAENVPGLAQRQDPDRVRAGRAALAAGEGDCLLLDDGFQHLALERDLDVVAVDAREPFRGGLRREGRGGLAHAGVVVATRCDGLPADGVARLRAEVRALAPGAALVLAEHAPVAVVPLGGGPAAPPTSLRGRPVWLAAGIARPETFRAAVEALGARVLGATAFPDHALTTLERLRDVLAAAARAGAGAVVVTQKDAVKLARSAGTPPLPVLSLRVRLRIVDGAEALRGALADALARGRARAAEGA